MPRKPEHTYNDPDDYLVDQLPPEFWRLMRSMLPIRKPTKTELRRLNWCEATTLCQELGGNGALVTDTWESVERNCCYLIANGILHLGHIEAMLHARTRCRISASITSHRR